MGSGCGFEGGVDAEFSEVKVARAPALAPRILWKLQKTHKSQPSHGVISPTSTILFASFFNFITRTSTMSSQSESSQPQPSSSPLEGSFKELPFPPVTKSHVLNCSYHNWHPK